MNTVPHSDESLQQITGQIVVGQTILIAYKLGLFKFLCKAPLSTRELAKKLKISERSTQALLSCSASLNLVEFKNSKYQLSDSAKEYLNPSKKTYYGPVLDLLIDMTHITTYENIKKCLQKNEPLIPGGRKLFKNPTTLSSERKFISALHHKSINPAFYWPTKINLKKYKTFVDMGSGSGIHTISACTHYSNLKGIACERPSVASHTRYFVKKFGLSQRIDVYEIDMWKDNFPSGDVFFFGDIFHDWPKSKCKILAKKSFDSLPSGGQIILHEMLFNDEKTGPFLTSAYNMKMMLWTEGQQLTGIEVKKILIDAGFHKIKIKKSIGNWSLITAEKP